MRAKDDPNPNRGAALTSGSLPQQVPRLTHGIATPGAIVVVQARAEGMGAAGMEAEGMAAATPSSVESAIGRSGGTAVTTTAL